MIQTFEDFLNERSSKFTTEESDSLFGIAAKKVNKEAKGFVKTVWHGTWSKGKRNYIYGYGLSDSWPSTMAFSWNNLEEDICNCLYTLFDNIDSPKMQTSWQLDDGIAILKLSDADNDSDWKDCTHLNLMLSPALESINDIAQYKPSLMWYCYEKPALFPQRGDRITTQLWTKECVPYSWMADSIDVMKAKLHDRRGESLGKELNLA